MRSRQFFLSLFLACWVLSGCSKEDKLKDSNDKNEISSLAELEKRASSENPHAPVFPGMINNKGDGDPKDPENAFGLVQKTALEGDSNSQINLGWLYNDGEGVPRDLGKAFEWWQKSASQGNADGQVLVGIRYYLGKGVPKDYVLSYAWINLAAARIDSPRLNELRNHLENILTIGERSEAQALTSNWKMGDVLFRKGK